MVTVFVCARFLVVPIDGGQDQPVFIKHSRNVALSEAECDRPVYKRVFPILTILLVHIRPPAVAAADGDSPGRWTAQPKRCEPVCWRWRPPLCCVERDL